jgi:peroxiredoxin
MRWLIGIALVVWLAALALPQGRGEGGSMPTFVGPRQAAESAGSAGSAQSRARDEADQALLAEYQAEVRAWRLRLRESQREGRALPGGPDEPFYPRFLELSRAGSVPATIWCLRRDAAGGAPRQSQEMLNERGALYRRLLDGLATNADLIRANLVQLLCREPANGLGREAAIALSREFEQATKDESVRRMASYARARLLAASGTADAEAIGRARELYAEIRRLQPGTQLARGAGDELWRLDHLALGRTAPNFVTADGFGNELRLEDHRGSIVVAHFSRFLEPESREALIALRKLSLEFWDADFMLLGVSSGEDRQALLRLCEEEDFLWPIAVEGETPSSTSASAAPSATEAWRVREWPQTFVLDGAGAVRFTGLEGEELTAAVRTLLEERAR